MSEIPQFIRNQLKYFSEGQFSFGNDAARDVFDMAGPLSTLASLTFLWQYHHDFNLIFSHKTVFRWTSSWKGVRLVILLAELIIGDCVKRPNMPTIQSMDAGWWGHFQSWGVCPHMFNDNMIVLMLTLPGNYEVLSVFLSLMCILQSMRSIWLNAKKPIQHKLVHKFMNLFVDVSWLMYNMQRHDLGVANTISSLDYDATIILNKTR